MKEKIKIKSIDNTFQKVEIRYKKGDFAIHENISKIKWPEQKFTITHIPSGMKVVSQQFIKNAKPIVDELAKCPIKWDGKTYDNTYHNFVDSLKKIID